MIKLVETPIGWLKMVVDVSHLDHYSQLPDWIKDFIGSQPLCKAPLSGECKSLLVASELTFSPCENGKDYDFILVVPSHRFWSTNRRKYFNLNGFSSVETLNEGDEKDRRYKAFRRAVFDFWTIYLQQANPFFAEGE